VESSRGAAETLRRLLEDRDLTQATKYAVSITLGVGDLSRTRASASAW